MHSKPQTSDFLFPEIERVLKKASHHKKRSYGWSPWHGCHKLSEGCRHCYMYRIDARHGRDSSKVVKNKEFYLPVKKTRAGEYKIPAGSTVYTCFGSDFFVTEADEWRKEAWAMMRERSDLHFFFITKRIDRFYDCIPEDWGNGYDNVTIACTMENQDMADYRLPIYKTAPIKHKTIICEPLLSKIDLSAHLGKWAGSLVAGGESGTEARVCDYDWVLDLRRQCEESRVNFYFKQTGARLRKDGKVYRILKRLQHAQARKAGINLHF
ncbi:protein gp37 [Parelusimicrobium proximum]|uniref:DUF5131 family protein n=1 Tax=Parelusimicrobium proximum TaxID=3228953 RepID=UPI003D165AA7